MSVEFREPDYASAPPRAPRQPAVAVRLPSGKWRSEITRSDGSRYARVFPLRRDAEDWMTMERAG